VVDAYDAMVNDRVYRRAMTPERAQEELRRHAGTQFDPLIVSEFLRMLQEESTPGENHEEPLTEPEESEVEILFPDSSLEGTDTLQNVHLIQYSRYLLDEELYICSADEMFEELTGYPLQELQLHTLRQYDLIPEEDRTEYMCLINEQMAQGQMAYFEHRLLKKDGSIIYVFGHGRRYYDALARTPRIEILLADSASTYSAQMLARVERSKAQARLERWESTYRRDSLTGLLSHAAFMSDVEIKLLSGKNKVMMLMIDLDMFKAYNDTYGHHAGDEFLIQTAQALTNSLRKDDLACRMGGDEFAAAIFFPVDASDELMGQRGQQIFDRMSLTLRSAKEGTSISMGGAVAEAGQSTFNQLYEAADQALYRAKEQGRGRFSL
jgi:diguanylate cyclase (GGDEF)-like protein/PAS domain S-box-containing protein